MTTTRRQIEIRVLDVHGRVLEFVEVTATPLSGGSVVRLHYDRRVNAHVVASRTAIFPAPDIQASGVSFHGTIRVGIISCLCAGAKCERTRRG